MPLEEREIQAVGSSRLKAGGPGTEQRRPLDQQTPVVLGMVPNADLNLPLVKALIKLSLCL
jgi:hypothetical protein